MNLKDAGIDLHTRVRDVLDWLSRSRTEEPRLVERATMVLHGVGGMSHAEQGRRLGMDPQRPRRWTKRWIAANERLTAAAASSGSDRDLEKLVLASLADEPRSGTPPKFSAEQVARLIALACEKPESSNIPVNRLTPDELAREAVKRGIVESISARHLDRLMKEVDLRPHRSRYWLTSPDKLSQPDIFQQEVAAICDLYRDAADLQAGGVYVVSVDERTGMQALERIHPTKPWIPGEIERVEFEYVRHGALCLTANFDVVTGAIVEPTIAITRNNEDFLGHTRRLVGLNPMAGWVLVADNLDTHKSEALVRWVAAEIGDDQDLGEMSKSGILASRKSRTEYLSDPTHRIRFAFTPRHTSWMNQVELWFGVLSRRFLRRASFTSLDDLRMRLMAFIEYFNAVLAHPYKWTYTGRPLRV